MHHLLLAPLALIAGISIPSEHTAVTVEVTTVADSGKGSFREALLDPDASTIAFAVPGEGPHVIELLSELPVVTRPLVIDAQGRGVVLSGGQAGAGARGAWSSRAR